jgi:membrane protease YdiL (CAAX protease family)
MNKQRKTSVWWSLLLIGIYLWIQVVTAVIFTVGLIIIKTVHSGQSGVPLDFEDIMQTLTGEYMLIILFVSAIVALLICLLIYRWRKIRVFEHMKLKSAEPKILFLAIPTGLAIEFTAMVIFSLTASLFKQSAQAYESMVSGMMSSWFAFIAVGLVAPIVEDFIFRGLILNELRRNYSVTVAIIIQAVLFGAMHLNISQGVYATFAGLILGIIAVSANSVWPAVIGHIMMNSSALFLSYVDEAALNVLLVPIIGVSVLFLFIMIYRSVNKIKQMNGTDEYDRNNMRDTDII